MKKKITFALLTLAALGYIFTVFYLSEPKYIDYTYKAPEKYDYIHVADYENRHYNLYSQHNGMVMQIDSVYMLVKEMDRSWSSFEDMRINSKKYRIVGKGTIYHKVNSMIGFNIMMITQGLVALLLVVFMFRYSGLFVDLYA